MLGCGEQRISVLIRYRVSGARWQVKLGGRLDAPGRR